MTGRDLQKAMSDINDDFILEASPDRAGAKPVLIWHRRSFRVISGLAAACLVLVIGINTFLIRHPNSQKTAAPVTDMDTASDSLEEKALEEKAFEDTPLNTYEAPAAPDLSSPDADMGMAFEAEEADMGNGADPALIPATEMETSPEAISEAETETEAQKS